MSREDAQRRVKLDATFAQEAPVMTAQHACECAGDASHREQVYTGARHCVGLGGASSLKSIQALCLIVICVARVCWAYRFPHAMSKRRVLRIYIYCYQMTRLIAINVPPSPRM